MRYARLLEPYKGYWDIQVDEDSATGGYMNTTVPSSEAERRLPAAGMSLSLLTEYKGNGQSNQLPTLFVRFVNGQLSAIDHGYCR